MGKKYRYLQIIQILLAIISIYLVRG